jgi:hypothetical protein
MHRRDVLLLGLAVAVPAWGGAAEPAPRRAKLEVSSRPDAPWRAEPSGEPDQYLVKWTLIVRETGGLDVSLDALRLLAEDVGSGEKLEMPALDAEGIAKLVKTRALPESGERTSNIVARASLELPLRFYFAGPRRHLQVRVEIEGLDTEGNRVRAVTPAADIR